MPSIDERARHDLFEAVLDKLDARHADTLMRLLPPVGWADVATKADLGAIEARMDQRFERLEQRFDQRFELIDRRFEQLDGRFGSFEHRLIAALHKSQSEHLKVMIFAFTGALATMTSVCLSAVALAT